MSQLLTSIIVLFVCTFTFSSALAACNSATSCSLREYLASLKSERDDLECHKVRLERAIDLISTANNTKILNVRIGHKNKIVDAITHLNEEISIIDAKCSTYQGPQCNECPFNYHGTNCSLTTCNGISSNDSSVCSSRGRCSSFDVCICNEPFYGNNCEKGNSTISNFGSYMGYIDGGIAKTCLSYYKAGATISGNYRIQPSLEYPAFNAYCEMANPLAGKKGWTKLWGYETGIVTEGIKDFTFFSELYVTGTDGSFVVISPSTSGTENVWTKNRIRYVGPANTPNIPVHLLIDNSKGVEEDIGAYCGGWNAKGHFSSWNYNNVYTIGARFFMDCRSYYGPYYKEGFSITWLKYINSNNYSCSTCNPNGQMFLY